MGINQPYHPAGYSASGIGNMFTSCAPGEPEWSKAIFAMWAGWDGLFYQIIHQLES